MKIKSNRIVSIRLQTLGNWLLFTLLLFAFSWEILPLDSPDLFHLLITCFSVPFFRGRLTIPALNTYPSHNRWMASAGTFALAYASASAFAFFLSSSFLTFGMLRTWRFSSFFTTMNNERLIKPSARRPNRAAGSGSSTRMASGTMSLLAAISASSSGVGSWPWTWSRSSGMPTNGRSVLWERSTQNNARRAQTRWVANSGLIGQDGVGCD